MRSDSITSSEEDGVEDASEVDRENPNPTDSPDDEYVTIKPTNQRRPAKQPVQWPVSLGLISPSSGTDITSRVDYLWHASRE